MATTANTTKNPTRVRTVRTWKTRCLSLRGGLSRDEVPLERIGEALRLATESRDRGPIVLTDVPFFGELTIGPIDEDGTRGVFPGRPDGTPDLVSSFDARRKALADGWRPLGWHEVPDGSLSPHFATGDAVYLEAPPPGSRLSMGDVAMVRLPDGTCALRVYLAPNPWGMHPRSRAYFIRNARIDDRNEFGDVHDCREPVEACEVVGLVTASFRRMKRSARVSYGNGMSGTVKALLAERNLGGGGFSEYLFAHEEPALRAAFTYDATPKTRPNLAVVPAVSLSGEVDPVEAHPAPFPTA